MNETLVLAFTNATTLPVSITSSSSTNWTQWIISLVISSAMLFWIFFIFFGGSIRVFLVRLHLRSFSKLTGRKSILIAHHQTGGFFGLSMITRDDVLKLQKALLKLKGKDVNLIIHSPGGDAFAALLMSRMLREYQGKIFVYVPQYAMSGGSLLALSGNHLYLSEFGCLGPIDPQVGSFFSYGPAAGWKEIVHKKKGKAEDKSHMYNRSGRQAELMIRDHLSLLLPEKELVRIFSDGRYHHGHPFTKSFLVEHGIEVGDFTKEMNLLLGKIIVVPIEKSVVMTL